MILSGDRKDLYLCSRHFWFETLKTPLSTGRSCEPEFKQFVEAFGDFDRKLLLVKNEKGSGGCLF